MRKAEIHILEWVNVNLEHNFITVTAQEAKNKRIRRIAINRSLRGLLLKLNLISGIKLISVNSVNSKRAKSILQKNVNGRQVDGLGSLFPKYFYLFWGEYFY